jgi:hypothetical protein
MGDHLNRLREEPEAMGIRKRADQPPCSAKWKRGLKHLSEAEICLDVRNREGKAELDEVSDSIENVMRFRGDS